MHSYQGRTVIIATGANAKWLEIPSEAKFKGKGVSSCATCDGFFFKDKEVAVVGGGDTAMEEASFLANITRKVTIIHRRDKLRASQIMQDRVMNNPRIRFAWDSQVREILGDQKVSGVRLENVKSGKETTLTADGVFVAIAMGLTPRASKESSISMRRDTVWRTTKLKLMFLESSRRAMEGTIDI